MDIIPKSIIEHESDLDVIQPVAYAEMLKSREKTTFIHASVGTTGPLSLYTTDGRMNLIEEDDLDENIQKLIGLRPNDVSLAFSLMVEGLSLYSLHHRYLDGLDERLRPLIPLASLGFGTIVQSSIEAMRSELKVNPEFRGTLGARFVTGIKLRYDGHDVQLDFLAKTEVVQFTNLDLVKFGDASDNFTTCPKLNNRFVHSAFFNNFQKRKPRNESV